MVMVNLSLPGYNDYVETFNFDGNSYAINANLTLPEPPIPVFLEVSPTNGSHFGGHVVTVSGRVEMEYANGSRTSYDSDIVIMFLNYHRRRL
ncbi:hypothetical protein GW813_04945 [bacterium]|nr:hypothetical protein [bacterium]